MSNILLSICIPTFNRASVLKKSIYSIVSQTEFNELVELVISDNCSDDNTLQVVEEFQKLYPNIIYHRNNKNIGAEKNVFNVLELGKGKFLKLSNDYSIFNEGSIKSINEVLLNHQLKKSVIFFSNQHINTEKVIKECKNIDEFISMASYWVTWMLCFGIWKSEFDLLKKEIFEEYNFPHLDLLLRNLELGLKPIVICNKPLWSPHPISEKGGYNLFETFTQNYLTILSQHIGENKISKSTFESEKRKLLHNFIYPYYCDVIIDKNKTYNFDIKGARYYLIKYFKTKDILIFIYRTLKYKIKKRSRFMFYKKMKKRILSITANILYKIIHSKPYKSLEEPKNNYRFKHLGENSTLPAQRIIKNPQYISIGRDFISLQNLRIEAWDEYAGERFYPEIIIGNNVIMSTDVHIGCINKIIIGNNVLFASRIYISDHSHGEITKEALSLPPSLRQLKSKGPVIIKDNVWIGEGVTILPGITIGENSIIGANSVVTKSVPPNCVVGGNPAKILKTLD